MKKKLIIIFASIFIVILIYILLLNIYFGSGIELIINWKVFLPKPTQVDIMYQIDFMEGESFEIWLYTDKSFDKVIKNKYFQKITEENIEEVKMKLEKYYKSLYFEEYRTKFNDKVISEELLSINNYYLYKEDSKEQRTFILLLADIKTKKVYFFKAVW